MAVGGAPEEASPRSVAGPADRLACAADLGCFAVVLAAAAYTRLGFLNQVMFGDDEAAVSQLAVAFVEGKGFPLIGMHMSIGVNNLPTFVWLMAIPYAFTRDPALATGFVGFLGLMAVVGCYFVTRAYFGALAAVVASLLFAVHPWAVIYSRKIWEQDVLPFFAVLFVGALLAYLDQGKGWQLVIALLGLAFGIEMHVSAAALLAVFIVTIVLYHDRYRWRHLLAGIAASAATTAPYLIWQAGHSWIDFSRAQDYANGISHWDDNAARLAYTMVASTGYVLSDHTAPFALVYQIEGCVFAIGMVFALASAVGLAPGVLPDQRRALGVLLVWVLASVLLFTRHAGDLPRHYFVVVLPAEFIIIGLVVATAYRFVVGFATAHRMTAWVRPISVGSAATVGAFVLSTVVVQLYDFTAFYRLQWLGLTSQRMIVDDIFNNGTPVGYTRALYREFVSLNSSHPNQPVYQQAPILEDLIAPSFLANAPLAVKRINSGGASALVLPPPGVTDALFATEMVDGRAAGLLQSLDPASHLLTMTYPQSDVKVAFYRLSADARPGVLQRLELQPLPYTLGNGVHFLGYHLPRSVKSGGSVELVTAWDVGEIPAGRPKYQFYAHLVDRTRRAWDKIDALDYNASQWSTGETVVSWHDLRVAADAPPGLYQVLIGMYTLDDTRPVPVFDAQGKSIDGGLTLGPIKVISGPLPTSADAVVQHRQSARLADQVSLLGYDLSETVAKPGDNLTLTLHWVAGASRPDYTVFVHLLDGSGKLVAQVDSLPRNGEYPTSVWDQGEYVRDSYQLALPNILPSGSYHIEIGMYQLANGQRLPVVNAQGQSLGDSIVLDSPIGVR
jgi:hypothetical protein